MIGTNIVQMSLIINIFTMFLSIYLASRAFRKDNIIAVIYWAVFVFMVVGQAIHISNRLFFSDEVRVLFNYISPEGHLLASILLCFCVVIIFLLERTYPTTKQPFISPVNRGTKPAKVKDRYFGLYYLFHWLLFFVLSLLLIKLVGGVNAWLFIGRPMASGATLLILAYGVVMYPLLIKLSSNLRVGINDILLFFSGTIMVLSFSRTFAVFFMLMLGVVYVYGYYSKIKSFTLKKMKWQFFLGAVLLFIMVFVFGTYRAIASHIRTDMSMFVSYVLENPEATLFSIDKNYLISIEGMSGFSAVMSEFYKLQQFRADLGLSVLTAFFHLVPSWLRVFFGNLPSHISNFYWYPNSVVAPGLEAVFVHFSFLGILIYPFAFYWFAYGIHQKMITLDHIRGGKYINTRLLVFTILAVFGLQIIKGSSFFLVEYIISELVIMYIAVAIFKGFNVVVREGYK